MKEILEEDKKSMEDLMATNIIGCEFITSLPQQPQRLLTMANALDAKKQYILVERGLRPIEDPYHTEEEVKRFAGPYVYVGNISLWEFSTLALVMKRKKSYIFNSQEEAFQWLMRPFDKKTK